MAACVELSGVAHVGYLMKLAINWSEGGRAAGDLTGSTCERGRKGPAEDALRC
jgi:hypothetical protein